MAKESRTNQIHSIQKVIDEHQRVNGGDDELHFLIDHLTNIRHWAKSKDLSFDEAVERSENLYLDEGGE